MSAASRALVCIFMVLAAIPSLRARQQPARDGATTRTLGLGRVSGVVTVDATPPVPLRHARVSLTAVDGRSVRSTFSDDDGTFTLDSAPAGRYTITASKGGYVTMAFGATRPGGAGVPLVLAEGQQIADIAVRVLRGAVITGTVRDGRGVPVPSIEVAVNRLGFAAGRRTLVAVPHLDPAYTDDRGVYRLFGLPPGDFVVSIDTPPLLADRAILTTTPSDVARARQMIDGPSRALASANTTQPVPAGRPVNYAPSYFPGTASPASAVPIRVAAGEERGGIDLPVLLVPTTRIEGTILDADGRPAQDVRFLIRFPRTGVSAFERPRGAADAGKGTFAAPALIPDSYELIAWVNTRTPRTGGGEPRDSQSRGARLDLTVDGTDQLDLTMVLRPTVAVSGRVRFESDGNRTEPSFAGSLMTLTEAERSWVVDPSQAIVATDGTFRFPGVVSGRYGLKVPTPAGWTLKSILGATGMPNTDLADVPFEVPVDHDVRGIVVTFTKATTTLAGTIQDAAGRPAPSYHAVVFSADRTYWSSFSRRIRAARPDTDGRFTITGLPAGDYLIAAVTDVEDGQWLDPAYLAELAPMAVKTGIVDGRTTVQVIKTVR